MKYRKIWESIYGEILYSTNKDYKFDDEEEL